LRESSVMPTARQSAKFSAGCRWRAPPGEHARPARRRPVAQHSGSERSARAGRTVEFGAGANRFSPVPGITPSAPTVASLLRKGVRHLDALADAVKSPFAGRRHHPCPKSGHVPKQDTCPETGLADIEDKQGSKVSGASGCRGSSSATRGGSAVAAHGRRLKI